MMIAGIILAAGESKRFLSQNKLLFVLDHGKCVLESVILAFKNSTINKIVVVTGHDSARIQKIIDKHTDQDRTPLVSVLNEDYESGGMSSSVIMGLKSVDIADAVLITPADIPRIPTETINSMILYFFRNQPDIIIPTFKKRKGHPILFKSTLFNEILQITEKKRGLKEITAKHGKKIVYLPTQDPGILKDIDSVKDLEQFSDLTMIGKNSL
ncbi:MAG: nucleotidyltransferase family protein [Candidatus Hodarchaeales archaeon]|jgi:molybdenum cofactor cytidylyltransferase